MNKAFSRKSGLTKPRCAECGLELGASEARYESVNRLYCRSCEPVAKVKEQWRPLGSGVVSKIFVLTPAKNRESL